MAFAVRVARRFEKLATPSRLDSKLETYRKRAKRRSIAAVGHTAYKRAAEQWACASRWIRFNLLPLPTPRGFRYHKPRKFYRQQFRTMLAFAEAVIAERCTEPLSTEELQHLVKLIIREIRRGRHPGFTVRELVADEQRAKDFLFEVIKRKKDDLKLRFEFMSIDQQWAERAEKHRSAMIIESDETESSGSQIRPSSLSVLANAGTTPSENTSMSRAGVEAGGKNIEAPGTVIEPSHTRTVRQETEEMSVTKPLRFPEQDVISWVAKFLQYTVGPFYWGTLLNNASFISQNWKPCQSLGICMGTWSM